MKQGKSIEIVYPILLYPTYPFSADHMGLHLGLHLGCFGALIPN